MIVKLTDNTTYEPKGEEYLTFGVHGVYIWKNKEQVYPPVKYFVYGFVKEVDNNAKT